MIPAPSRIQIPQWAPETPSQHAENLRVVESGVNDLPIFPRYTSNTGPMSSWSASSSTSVPWGGTPAALRIHFTKQFSWTDLFVEFSARTGATGGLLVMQYEIAIQTQADFDAGSSTFTNTYLGNAQVSTTGYEPANGWNTISGLRANTYYAELQAFRNPSNTMITDGNCFGCLLIMETPPAD